MFGGKRFATLWAGACLAAAIVGRSTAAEPPAFFGAAEDAKQLVSSAGVRTARSPVRVRPLFGMSPQLATLPPAAAGSGGATWSVNSFPAHRKPAAVAPAKANGTSAAGAKAAAAPAVGFNQYPPHRRPLGW